MTILKFFAMFLCLFLTGCHASTKYGTLPYDDSAPYIEVPVSVPNDILNLMQKKGYEIGQFKALPLARVLKYRERYLNGIKDITHMGWFTSIKTNDNHIYYIFWEDNKTQEIQSLNDALWFYFIDDNESNQIINRKKEANRINKWYWINWRE